MRIRCCEERDGQRRLACRMPSGMRAFACSKGREGQRHLWRRMGFVVHEPAEELDGPAMQRRRLDSVEKPARVCVRMCVRSQNCACTSISVRAEKRMEWRLSHTRTHTETHTDTRARARSSRTDARTHTHARTHTGTHTHARARTHKYTQKRARTRTRTSARTNTHTRTHSRTTHRVMRWTGYRKSHVRDLYRRYLATLRGGPRSHNSTQEHTRAHKQRGEGHMIGSGGGHAPLDELVRCEGSVQERTEGEFVRCNPGPSPRVVQMKYSTISTP